MALTSGTKTQHCMLCFNGGMSIDCTTCPGCICFECASALRDLPTLVLKTAKFVCPQCWERKEYLKRVAYTVRQQLFL